MISWQIEYLVGQPTTASHLHQLHALLLKTALCGHSYPVSRLIHRATSISLPLARALFDGLAAASPPPPPPFAWNCLIHAYANSSAPSESVGMFARMLRAGIKADSFSYPFVLRACGQGSLIGEGRGVHSLIIRTGFESDKFVGNTLLSMYGACGAIDLARKVFDELPSRNVISWTAMIGSCVAFDASLDAFEVFQGMKLANVKPNSATLVNLLSACSQLVNIRVGESIHAYAIVNSVELDAALGTALLKMYSKCSHIERAWSIFRLLEDKDLQTWTIMISGLAENGFGKDAVALFNEMQNSGLMPDGVLFSVILSACSHCGLVEEGRNLFYQLEKAYGIEPSVEHYGCMVDLLGRAGFIEEAYEMIKKMPMKPNSIVLRSFVGACTTYGQAIPVDDSLRRFMLELEPRVGANYVLAANWSSLSQGWDEAAHLRSTMRGKSVKKVVGSSWVEMNADSYLEAG